MQSQPNQVRAGVQRGGQGPAPAVPAARPPVSAAEALRQVPWLSVWHRAQAAAACDAPQCYGKRGLCGGKVLRMTKQSERACFRV